MAKIRREDKQFAPRISDKSKMETGKLKEKPGTTVVNLKNISIPFLEKKDKFIAEFVHTTSQHIRALEIELKKIKEAKDENGDIQKP